MISVLIDIDPFFPRIENVQKSYFFKNMSFCSFKLKSYHSKTILCIWTETVRTEVLQGILEINIETISTETLFLKERI